MKKREFKSRAMDVPSDDIFLNDKLERKKSVENISLLLNNISAPLVFAINAPWGAGKTAYLKMLHASVVNEGKKAVYFSAWETDFASDPLLAFLGEMNATLNALVKDPKKRRAWGVAKKAGVHILKNSVPVAVKLATAGLIDAEKIVEDETSKLAQAFSSDLIAAYSKNKEAISKFKESVEKVLLRADGEYDNLYIFVDELDRCRPTYAIELLERVKHVLDIKGLVFVMALDREQLSHSVKAVYGSEFDALGYLKRFMDIEYNLPAVKFSDFVVHLYEYFGFKEYFDRRSHPDTQDDGKDLLSAISILADANLMSLRGLEQLFQRLNIILLSVPLNHYMYSHLFAFLLFVRDVYPKVYSDFAKDSGTGDELISILLKLTESEANERGVRYFRLNVCSLIIAGKMSTNDEWHDKYLSDIQRNLVNETFSESQRDFYSRVVDLTNHKTSMGRSVPLSAILARVDMLTDFEFSQPT